MLSQNCIEKQWNTGTIKELIYKDLLKYEENKNMIGKELQSYSSFNKVGLNNPASILFINENERFLSIYKTVDLIHRNGGLCFLAHVYQYDVKNHIDFLNEIIEEIDLDGIEIRHSSFSKEQVEKITKYADQKGLYKSGGSDFHGRLKPGINLGLDMTIGEDIIKPWIDKVI